MITEPFTRNGVSNEHLRVSFLSQYGMQAVISNCAEKKNPNIFFHGGVKKSFSQPRGLDS